MPKIELYGSALCPYAQRVRLALAEKQLAATEIEIDPRNKPARFLAMSPLGKVPLLVHGGARLWESAAINEYLEEAFPERPLLPEPPALRALARIWVSFADDRLYGPTHRLLLCTDPDLQVRFAAQLADDVRFIESRVLGEHGGPFWLGEEVSLADIAFFPWFEQIAVLERFRRFRMPEECGRIMAWRDAVAGRQGVRAAARSPEFYVEGYAPLLGELARSAAAA